MSRISWRNVFVAVIAASGLRTAEGQQPRQPTPAAPPAGAMQQSIAPLPLADRDQMRLTYTLGQNDEVSIRVLEVEELNGKTFKVDAEGNLVLPIVGPLRAEGLKVSQLEADLTKRLEVYYRNPRVTITISRPRQDPVIFAGAFVTPGLVPLQGSRRLVEMLGVVGLAANASNRLRVTRRLENGVLPLPNAVQDRERNISYVEISVSRLMETVHPEENLELMPYDVIRVGTQEMVYVTGNGVKSGAFPLADKDSLSVMQVLVLSGGLSPNAQGDKAKVMRPVLDTARRSEIPLDVSAILQGRANDFPLLPNDILVIPSRKSGFFQSRMGNYVAAAVPALITSLVVIAIRN